MDFFAWSINCQNREITVIPSIYYRYFLHLVSKKENSRVFRILLLKKCLFKEIVWEGENEKTIQECIDKSFAEPIHSFKCNNCNAIFKNRKHLDQHIICVHEGNRPFQCSICNDAFSKEESLINHKETVHEGKRPFRCFICNTGLR